MKSIERYQMFFLE